MQAGTGYRKDIDGLRALAVGMVVAFHAGLSQLRGGFTGVDVFFVISGFLITGLLAAELGKTGTISITGFYARRFARIVPSLALVTALALVAGLLILSPTLFETHALAKSAAATMLFVANLYFLGATGDYFAPDSGGLPLLHMWSLGIEEQYYLVWPLLLLLAGWIGRRAGGTLATCRVAIVVVTLASLAVCAAITPDRPSQAFYLPFTRFWELGIGSALALLPLHKLSERLGGVLAALGIGLVGLGAFVASEGVGFPFPLALLPTLGTALMIAGNGAAPENPVARLFSLRPLVHVGTLSYAWYLWHWPPLAYAHVLWAGTAPGWVRVAAALGSLLAAQITVTLWEMPLRRRARTVPPRQVLLAGFAAIGLVSLLAAGIWTAAKRGWLPDDPRISSAFSDRSPKQGQCLLRSGATEFAADCLAAEGQPRVVLWGDSHGDQWAPALADWAARHSPWQVEQLTMAAWPPVTGVVPLEATPGKSGPDRSCAEINRQALARIIGHREPQTVVLAANWAPRAGIELQDGSLEVRRAWFDVGASNPNQSLDALDRGLSASLSELSARHIPVILLLQSPMQARLPATCVVRLGAGQCGMDAAQFRDRSAPVTAQIRAVAARFSNVTVLDPASIQCLGVTCPAALDGRIAYYDSEHLTASTARSARAMTLWNAALDAAQVASSTR